MTAVGAPAQYGTALPPLPPAHTHNSNAAEVHHVSDRGKGLWWYKSHHLHTTPVTLQTCAVHWTDERRKRLFTSRSLTMRIRINRSTGVAYFPCLRKRRRLTIHATRNRVSSLRMVCQIKRRALPCSSRRAEEQARRDTKQRYGKRQRAMNIYIDIYQDISIYTPSKYFKNWFIPANTQLYKKKTHTHTAFLRDNKKKRNVTLTVAHRFLSAPAVNQPVPPQPGEGPLHPDAQQSVQQALRSGGSVSRKGQGPHR